MRQGSIGALSVVGAAAGASLFCLGRGVESRELVSFDQQVRARLLPVRNPMLDALSSFLTALSAPGFLVPATLAIAFSQRHRGVATWLPISLAPFVAMTAGQLMTLHGPQQFPPDATDEDHTCFPSGHTTSFTTEALTVAYILRRERVLSRSETLLLLMLPLAAGMNRLYRDRHWASDIAGGLAAGTAVGAACAIVSDILQIL